MSFIVLHKIDTRAYREDEGDAPRMVPVVVAIDSIRCFTPRRDNRPGTRITFKDGGGFVVNVSPAQLLANIGQADLVEQFQAASATATVASPSISIVGGTEGQPN